MVKHINKKIAWIYPFNRKKGVYFYAENYIRALSGKAEIIQIDLDQCLHDKKIFQIVNDCDLVHIQYITEYFGTGQFNSYRRFIKQITPPVIVTLHEIYDEFPGIFPRSRISGKGLVRKIKELIYDFRHPAYRHWLNHLRASFGARLCIVHYPFQKEILVNKGFKRQIEIVPHPVEKMQLTARQNFYSGNELELGSSGFINLNYDYNELFSVLESLEIPWRFTWIGGLRRKEDSVLLDSIVSKIKSHGWRDKFTITGWMDENGLNKNLCNLDIYLALFSNRSTSSTIMKALAAECLIIARQLPLTTDLNSDNQIMLTVSEDDTEIINTVNRLITDSSLQREIIKNIRTFKEQYSYENMALRHVRLYDQL
jgi:hypothetical protein